MNLRTKVSAKLQQVMTLLENAEQSIEVRGTIKWLARAEGAASQISEAIEVAPAIVEEPVKKPAAKKKSKWKL
jgi:hypothetical protein